MAKVFANVCFCDVFVLFECSALFCKRCEPFCILGFVCKVLKKGKVYKMCVSSWKKREHYKKERKRKKEKKEKKERKKKCIWWGKCA